jgi:hypothetical protein
VTKVERKGHNEEELLRVVRWLTGFAKAQIQKHIAKESTIAELFEAATLNPEASSITGLICGHRVEDIENPPTQKARQMDTVVDELARGK